MHFPSRSAKWELYTNHWLGFTSNARKTNDSTSCKVPAELLVKISSLLFLLWDVRL